MTAKILCTIGPASLNRHVLTRLEALGVSLFRINLSHTAIEDVERVIAFLQANSKVPVCLDSEGAQVRTGFASTPVRLVDNAFVDLHVETVEPNGSRLTLTPPEAVPQLRRGDIVTLDFNGAAVQVVEAGAEIARARVINGGLVGVNKAVSVDREIELPAISPKDRAAIQIGVARGVVNFALSFAGSGRDVEEMRGLIGPESWLISKIESMSGLAHLEDIATRSDAILIDRGDLSRQVPIERIPAAQKDIIRRTHAVDRPVFVATNLLESMIHASSPTRAEVNDVFNTLADGADGLVLAAETAIGAWPIQCVSMVRKVAHEFEHRDQPGARATFSSLPAAHGGALVHQAASLSPDELAGLPGVVLGHRELMDAEQIALGAFSPITGFMDRATLQSVLQDLRLPDGAPWAMPIVLQIPASSHAFAPGARVRLLSAAGATHSILDVTETFELDPREISEAWFGTASLDHPGVARLLAGGGRFAAGRVSLVEPLADANSRFSMSPTQVRQMFDRKGWQRVVGFQTRTVLNRAHEFIQLAALDRADADGLLIHPLIGAGRDGDFEPSAVLASYELCLASGVYPQGKAMLAAFASAPRFAGPREAVFAAQVRRNYGCSHFVVDSDLSTGVGAFDPYDTRRLFDRMEDIGIEPIFFDQVAWNAASRTYGETPRATGRGAVCDAKVKSAIGEGKSLPDWVIRADVQSMLRERVAGGRGVFVG